MDKLVYGIHAVQAIVENDPNRVLCVYMNCNFMDSRLAVLANQIKKKFISIQKCHKKYLDIKVRGALHQGVIAEIFQKDIFIREHNLPDFIIKSNKFPLLLILDGITDPHNLGACFRSADAAGVDLIIIPRNRSANINGTVRKVASGSADKVPLMRVTNLARTLRFLKNDYDIWIVGTVLRSNKFIFDSNLVRPLALVMGSEGYGIRFLTKKICDELISIPMMRTSASLNVSVATGICLFEILRQRRINQ